MLFVLFAGFYRQGFSQEINENFLRKYISYEPGLEHRTIEDGLPSNTVNMLVQDGEGYIWMATFEGLVRFDGLSAEVFNSTNTDAIPHNRFTGVYYTENGRVWAVLEYGGIVRFDVDSETFRYFSLPDNDDSYNISDLIFGKNFQPFYVTDSGLFKHTDTDRIQQVFAGENNQEREINDLQIDDDGVIWLATEGGLIRINAETGNRKFVLPGNNADNRVMAVHRDKYGRLLAGTMHGVFMADDGRLRRVDNTSEMAEKHVRIIYEDDKALLLSTSGGLYRMDENRLTYLEGSDKESDTYEHFYRRSDGELWMVSEFGRLATAGEDRLNLDHNPEKIQQYMYQHVYEDAEGNLWLSTERSGVFKLTSPSIGIIGVPEGLTGNNILGLYKDTVGRYWIGTRGDGLHRIDENGITHYAGEEDIRTKIVHTITEDSTGAVWVGHFEKGIDIISGDSVRHVDLSEDVNRNNVYALFTDSKGNIWAGTFGGLVLFNPEGTLLRRYTREDGLPGIQIRYITEGPDGKIWVGTKDGGLATLNNGKVVGTYGTADGLSSDNIRSVYADSSGVIWIGTENNGLNRIKDVSAGFVSVVDGLPDYNIHWISEDENGILWFSTNRGIVSVEKRRLNEYLDGESEYPGFVLYGKPEGMRSAEGNGSFQEAGIRTEDYMMFATQNGVAVLQPGRAKQSGYSPVTRIEHFIAGNQKFRSDSLVLDGGDNDVLIRYSAVTHINPEQVMYRYRINGGGWIFAGKRNELQLSNLSPGTYNLEITAMKRTGGWSERITDLKIEIRPTIYQRPVFYVFLIVLAVLLIIGVMRVRFRYLENRKALLEEQVREQTLELRRDRDEIKRQKQVIEEQADELREINNAKDKFLSIIAHDLRNPFQVMMVYTEMLLEDFDKISANEAKDRLMDVRNSAGKLLDLVEKLLSWAFLQTGKLEVQYSEFNLPDLLNNNLSLYKQSADQKGIKLNPKWPDNLSLEADRNMMDTVVRNLLSNALKFSEQDDVVTISADLSGNSVIIRVEDEGIGMSPEMVQNLLKLDQVRSRKGTGEEHGSGLGLQLCNDIINLHGGHLEIESEEGSGTVFTVIIPQNSEQLQKS